VKQVPESRIYFPAASDQAIKNDFTDSVKNICLSRHKYGLAILSSYKRITWM